MIKKILLLGTFLLTGAFAQAQSATPAASDEANATTITSERLQLDLAKGEGVFLGKVKVSSLKFTMTSDEMSVLFSKEGKPVKFIAKGQVVIVNETRNASSRQAEYDVAEKKITLTGEPVVTQQQNRVTGNSIVIYPDSDRMDVNGRSTVRIFQ